MLKNEGQARARASTISTCSTTRWTGLGRAVGESARLASSMLADLPLDGQFNLLTTTSFDRPQDLFSPDAALPRSVAFLSLAAPMPTGEWRMRGAITQGDLSSWTVAGSFARDPNAAHAYQAGFSYGMQRYQGGNAEALAAMRDGSRTVGMLYAYDNWTVAPRRALELGGRYANYGYLADQGLLSPRAGVTGQPLGERTRSRCTPACRTARAPRAPRSSFRPALGVWLPPERTFSPVSRGGDFTPERIDHVEAGGRTPDAGRRCWSACARSGSAATIRSSRIFGLSAADEVRQHRSLPRRVGRRLRRRWAGASA